MAKPEPPASFVDFVTARSDVLLRAAWLLTGDAGRAEDLLQTALAKAWRRWDLAEAASSPEAYVRRIIFTTHISWWRRRWRAEIPDAAVADRPASGDLAGEVATRDAVRRALLGLSHRSRAIVILRFVEDRPVAEVAELLGCSPATVKVQTGRAISALRRDPQLQFIILEGADT
jgi:RNA polymerase sigma-70 factor (sigma-E family)